MFTWSHGQKILNTDVVIHEDISVVRKMTGAVELTNNLKEMWPSRNKFINALPAWQHQHEQEQIFDSY